MRTAPLASAAAKLKLKRHIPDACPPPPASHSPALLLVRPARPRHALLSGVRQAVAMITAMEHQLWWERSRRQQAEEDCKVSQWGWQGVGVGPEGLRVQGLGLGGGGLGLWATGGRGGLHGQSMGLARAGAWDSYQV